MSSRTPRAVDRRRNGRRSGYVEGLDVMSRLCPISARSKGNKVLDELLSKVSDKDEETFELGKQISALSLSMNSVTLLSDDKALPHLFRVIYSLSPKWHGFGLQLGVPDLDDIKKNGTGADDCLVLALQNWLKSGNMEKPHSSYLSSCWWRESGFGQKDCQLIQRSVCVS